MRKKCMVAKGLCIINAPVNGLSSFSPHTTRYLEGYSFVTTRSAEIALGLLGEFSVGGPLVDCFRRGHHRHNRVVLTHVLNKRDYTLIASTNVPTVSSPNRSLISVYVTSKMGIMSIPNPATFTATITLSKLPSNEFAFRNFLDMGGRDHTRRLSDVGSRGHAVIFCRTPRGLLHALGSLCTYLNSHHVTVVGRLAGVRRGIRHAALGGTYRRCRGVPVGNRFMLIVRKTPRTTPRVCAIRSTITGTERFASNKVSGGRTTGGTTGLAKVGGDSVCGVLARRWW